MVLRTVGVSATRVDCGRHRKQRRQGEGVPHRAIPVLLPVPPRDALRVPTQVAGPEPVPANTRDPRDARAVDLSGGTRALPEGAARAAHHPGLGTAACPGVPRRGPRPARRSAARGRDRRRSRGRDRPGQRTRRRHQRPVPRHPPPGRNGHPLRVLWRTGRQGRPPSRAAFCARGHRHRHHDHRQHRGDGGGRGVLHTPSRNGRLPNPPQGNTQEGRERPPRVAGRGDGGQAGDAQAGGFGVRAKGGDPHHRVSGGRSSRSRRQQRNPRPAEAEARGDGPGDGMARKGRIRGADCEVDEGAREVTEDGTRAP